MKQLDKREFDGRGKSMKNRIIHFCVIIVFFLQLWKGFYVSAPISGFIPSGAKNEPIVVVFSALMACFVTWGLLELLFWVISKLKK